MNTKVDPSNRIRRRYLLTNSNKEGIEKAILDYIGILGWAKANPMFIEKGVVAINRKEIDNVKAAFELANIKVNRISGTLKGLEK
jgi:RNase P/RNase MRP subunit POP5